MTLTDCRGVAIACTSETALGHLERAVDGLLGMRGDPLVHVDAALAEEPDFCLARCLRAYLRLYSTRAVGVADAREAIAPAVASDARDAAHLAAAARWADGDLRGAAAALEGALALDPRDALALRAVEDLHYFTGYARDIRDVPTRVLPAWSADLPGYGYVLGMRAFGLEECGDYGAALEAGLDALERNPRDAWAVHAVAHVCEMENRAADGIRFLASRQPDWTRDSAFECHTWWHLALYHLELEQFDEVLRVYDERIGRRTGVLIDQVDAASLLWRLALDGVDVGERWQPLADDWTVTIGDGISAFNDLHATMAFLGAGRPAEVAAMLDVLRASAAGSGTNALMARDVGLPAALGFVAFDAGRHAEAVRLLGPLTGRTHRFGGSHAQRDVITQTLIAAAAGAGDAALLGRLLADRAALRPDSPLVARYAVR